MITTEQRREWGMKGYLARQRQLQQAAVELYETERHFWYRNGRRPDGKKMWIDPGVAYWRSEGCPCRNCQSKKEAVPAAGLPGVV